MKYIIASQHYKQWNNDHYECIAKFIKQNPDNTFSEVSPDEMVNNSGLKSEACNSACQK